MSSRHPARWGGGLAWRLGLGAALRAGAAASRTHRAPTFDQEVLDLGPGPAEPERTDAVELWIEHGGRWSWNVSGARRHLAGVPFIERQTLIKPWPLFRFRNRESAHWEVAAGALSPPVSRWQVRVGAWASRLVAVDGERRWSPAFIPDYLARAYLTAVLSYFADDLRLRPRVDLLLVGRRDDFSGGELASYVRLDGTLTAVMSQAVDLELTLRNLTDERYPLPVMQPGGELYRDSGQQLVIGLRWRLLD